MRQLANFRTAWGARREFDGNTLAMAQALTARVTLDWTGFATYIGKRLGLKDPRRRWRRAALYAAKLSGAPLDAPAVRGLETHFAQGVERRAAR